MIVTIAIVVALCVTIALTFSKFAKSDYWRATVTPIASIIGSGFLVCAPLLAREFGGFASLAMAALLAMAYIVGAVVRFNISHVEQAIADSGPKDGVIWVARASEVALSLAYAVSVAYYLKLLADFVLRSTPWNSPLASNIFVTLIIAFFTVLPFTGGLKRIEHLAHGSVAIKLGVIAGLLVALVVDWIAHANVPFTFPAGIVSVQEHLRLVRLAHHRPGVRDFALPGRLV